MTQYGVKFFRIEDGVEAEIEMDDLPDEYINGLIKMFRDESTSRERLGRVYRKMAENIESRLKGD